MTSHDTEAVVKRSPLTVMVVEKYPIARAALADLLRYDGHRVIQAESLEPAISLIDSHANLAVLLLDLDMPGWKTILRHADKRANVFVIAMEGKGRTEKDELHRRGIGLCFQKPINYEDIRKALKGDD